MCVLHSWALNLYDSCPTSSHLSCVPPLPLKFMISSSILLHVNTHVCMYKYIWPCVCITYWNYLALFICTYVQGWPLENRELCGSSSWGEKDSPSLGSHWEPLVLILQGTMWKFHHPYWQVNRFYQYARPVQATILLEFHVSIFSVISKSHYLVAGDQISPSYNISAHSSLFFLSLINCRGCVSDVSFGFEYHTVHSLHLISCVSL